MENKLEKLGRGHYRYKGFEICDAFVSENHDGSDPMLYHEYSGIKDACRKHGVICYIQKLVTYWQGRWYIRFNYFDNDDADRNTINHIELHPNTYGRQTLDTDEKGRVIYSDIRFYSTLEEIKEEIDDLYEDYKMDFLRDHAKKLKMFFDIDQTEVDNYTNQE